MPAGQKLSTVGFYSSRDEGLTWAFKSRIDGIAAMSAPDKRHQRSDPTVTGPAQAGLALLAPGQWQRARNVPHQPPAAPAPTTRVSSDHSTLGGNQGRNLWYATSSDGAST